MAEAPGRRWEEGGRDERMIGYGDVPGTALRGICGGPVGMAAEG